MFVVWVFIILVTCALSLVHPFLGIGFFLVAIISWLGAIT